jgi:hypothetical protein
MVIISNTIAGAEGGESGGGEKKHIQKTAPRQLRGAMFSPFFGQACCGGKFCDTVGTKFWPTVFAGSQQAA